MNIQILRVSNTRRRLRAKGGSTLDKAFVCALVDGHSVACSGGKGWRCDCGDDECDHPDALASVLHPDILAELEGEAQ
jgi:hypothetical protein